MKTQYFTSAKFTWSAGHPCHSYRQEVCKELDQCLEITPRKGTQLGHIIYAEISKVQEEK